MDTIIPCFIKISNVIMFNLIRKVITIKNKITTKEIPETNGRYLATSTGHIYDKKYHKYIAETKSARGWLKCHIWFKGKRITIGVHRLIMYAFHGVSDLTVNHINGNKEDNSIENLEYMTRQEQNKHRSAILKKGNRRPVVCIENGKVYGTIKEACDDLNIEYANSHISAVCKHKYGFKSSHGYHFEYFNQSVEDIERIS